MSSDIEQAVIAAFRAGADAMNRGDYEAAFAGLAPDVEWEVGAWIIDGGGTVLHGREQVITYFSAVRDAGQWRVEPRDVEELAPGQVLLRHLGRYVGRTTGITGQMEFFQVADLGEAGVRRIREFETRDEALAAVGRLRAEDENQRDERQEVAERDQ